MNAAKYTVKISRKARKYLDRMTSSQKVKRQLENCIEALGDNPRPHGYGPVKTANVPDTFRVRQGDLRILYVTNEDEKTVSVTAIKPRGDAYRK